MFDQNAFDDFILSIPESIGFYRFPITLKSGRKCNYYLDLRKANNTQTLKMKTAKFIYDFALENNLRPDVFFGIPEGATSIGEAVTELIDYKPKNEVPAVILRSKKKERGDPIDIYSVGHLEPGIHCVLVEDVSTTGISASEQVLRMNEKGVFVDAVIGEVSRLELRDDERTVQQYILEDFAVPYLVMTDICRLLPTAYKMQRPPEFVIKKVEDYFRQYSNIQLKLLP